MGRQEGATGWMNKELGGKIWVGDVKSHVVRDCPVWLKEEAGMYSISAVHLHSLHLYAPQISAHSFRLGLREQ